MWPELVGITKYGEGAGKGWGGEDTEEATLLWGWRRALEIGSGVSQGRKFPLQFLGDGKSINPLLRSSLR